MFASRKAKLIAATAAVGLGALAVPGTAFAANTPGPTQNVSGSVVVPTTLTMSLSFSSFTLNTANGYVDNGSGSTPGDPAGGFAVIVGSNDGGGYFVDETGPTNFADGSSTIADSYIYTDAPNATGGTHANYIPLTSAAQSIIQGATVSGTTNPGAQTGGALMGDDSNFFNGWEVSPSNPLPANTPAGTFTGDVTFSLWGN